MIDTLVQRVRAWLHQTARQLRTSTGRWHHAAWLAMAGALVSGAYVVGVSFRLIFRRLTFPHELEWMEGGILLHVTRVLDGKPIYAEPAPEFMAFIYTPLYYYVAAPLVELMGVSLVPLRLLSIAAALACIVLIGVLVRLETGGWLFPALAALLFGSTFELSGAWFDLARVDSLELALLLGAVVLARRAERPAAFALAGAVTALAFLTKQTAAVIAPVLLVWAAVVARWRGALAYLAALVAIAGTAMAYLQIQSHGWFWYYVVELPGTHGMQGREWLLTDFWRLELPTRLPIAIAVAVLFFSGAPFVVRPRRVWYGASVALMLLASAYVARLHVGSYLNDLMPAHAALAWLFGVTLHGMVASVPAQSTARARMSTACGVLAALQFLMFSGDLSRFAPRRGARAAGDYIVKLIRDTPGQVLVVNHPHFALLAGKPAYAHQMAMHDAFVGDSDPRGVRPMLLAKWRALFEQHRFSMVIVDNDWMVYRRELEHAYRKAKRLPIPKGALNPAVGTDLFPQWIYEPRQRSRRRGADPR